MRNPERTIKGLLGLLVVLWVAFFGATAIAIIFVGPEQPEVVNVLRGEETGEGEETEEDEETPAEEGADEDESPTEP